MPVARGVKRGLVHEHETERALDLPQHLDRRGLEAAIGMAREQRRDEVGVGRRPQRPVLERDLTAVGLGLLDELRKITGVRQISVVRQGNAAHGR